MTSVIEAPFVLVTGGKGGVGKTTVAANLGVEMAGAGKRVLIVDLDLGLANLNVLLGLDTPRTIEDALAGTAGSTSWPPAPARSAWAGSPRTSVSGSSS
jgi:MinD-like ATPase involved in chromosome partitioning or flagellar assembly